MRIPGFGDGQMGRGASEAEATGQEEEGKKAQVMCMHACVHRRGAGKRTDISNMSL